MYLVLIALMHGNKESLAFLLSCLGLQGKNELQVYLTFSVTYLVCLKKLWYLMQQKLILNIHILLGTIFLYTKNASTIMK